MVGCSRVLIIEDDVYLVDSLKRTLKMHGFEVASELSGAGGLARAAEQRPDAVILDLRLPDMHGYQVCQELRRRLGVWPVPIVMLTGMERPIDQLRGFAFGADAYLTKPCDPQEIVKTIRLLLRELAVAGQ